MCKEGVYIYTVESYSAIEEEEIMTFAPTCVDLEMIILSEVRQRKVYDIAYIGILFFFHLFLLVGG